jgi:lactoylglutathione lyase
MKIKYNTMIVKDMEKSVEFYRDICGFEIDSTYDLPNNAKITLLKSDGETFIELIENNVDEVGFYSVGMEVDDIHKEFEDLKRKGIKFILEPTKISVGYMALFKDLNGVNIVLLEHFD